MEKAMTAKSTRSLIAEDLTQAAQRAEKASKEMLFKRFSRTSLCFGMLLSCCAPSVAMPQQEKPITTTASTPPTVPAAPKAVDKAMPPPALHPILIPELMIAGHTVMRLRSTAGGLSPDERAYDLRRRLGPILTLPDLTASDITVQQARPRQTASIYVRGRLLITVDRNLAKANNTSIADLAMQWANNLKATLPQINVAVRMFDVSTGN